jgi:hypothetical protein
VIAIEDDRLIGLERAGAHVDDGDVVEDEQVVERRFLRAQRSTEEKDCEQKNSGAKEKALKVTHGRALYLFREKNPSGRNNALARRRKTPRMAV